MGEEDFAVDAVCVLLKGLKDQPAKLVEGLCALVVEGKQPISVGAYRGMTARIVRECFDNSAIDFCRYLRECAQAHALRPGLGRESLFRGAVAQLTLRSNETTDVSRSARIRITEAAYLASMLIGTGGEGEALHLLRRLGAYLTVEHYAGEIILLEASSYPDHARDTIIDALAEGQIKRLGPRKVLGFFLVKDMPPVGAEALKAELRDLCSVNNNAPELLAKRHRVIAWLSEIIGPHETQRWFADEFPHLVNAD